MYILFILIILMHICIHILLQVSTQYQLTNSFFILKKTLCICHGELLFLLNKKAKQPILYSCQPLTEKQRKNRPQNAFTKQNRSTEGCSKLKRSVDMTSSGKNGLNIRTNASPKWDRIRCPEE